MRRHTTPVRKGIRAGLDLSAGSNLLAFKVLIETSCSRVVEGSTKKGKGKKSHKYISRKNILEGERTLEGAINAPAPQQVQVQPCLRELGRVDASACAALPPRPQGPSRSP